MEKIIIQKCGFVFDFNDFEKIIIKIIILNNFCIYMITALI